MLLKQLNYIMVLFSEGVEEITISRDQILNALNRREFDGPWLADPRVGVARDVSPSGSSFWEIVRQIIGWHRHIGVAPPLPPPRKSWIRHWP